MRTGERLTRLKKWVKQELCEGRVMKTPSKNRDITEITRREPECYLAWAPMRRDRAGQPTSEEPLLNVSPCIIIMPSQTYAKYMEEKRFDRYNNVHRPPAMGQHLAVSILFSVYEPGTRLPGFIDSADENGKGLDMSLIREGTEEGLFTLFNWMDDCMQKLLGQKMIPDTDLFVEEASMTYSLYTDQSYVVDRRPLFYGFVNTSFGCYADEGVNREIDQYLL